MEQTFAVIQPRLNLSELNETNEIDSIQFEPKHRIALFQESNLKFVFSAPHAYFLLFPKFIRLDEVGVTDIVRE